MMRRDARVGPYCTPRVPHWDSSPCSRLPAGRNAIAPAESLTKCSMQVYWSCKLAQMQIMTMHCCIALQQQHAGVPTCRSSRDRLPANQTQEGRAGSAAPHNCGSTSPHATVLQLCTARQKKDRQGHAIIAFSQVDCTFRLAPAPPPQSLGWYPLFDAHTV
jgi:hypothetical protein